MMKTRRLVAWEYAAENAAADANGIVRGPTPFGALSVTDRVAVMVGSQGLVEFYARWGTGARAGEGLRKIFLYPQTVSFYGTATPGPNGDLNNNIPVYPSNADSRLTTADLGAAYAAGTTLKPMVYKPRAVAPTSPTAVEMGTVGLELNQYRFEIFREADPGATYRQADSFEMRLWGHEAQSFPAGLAVERPLFMTIGWEGTPNEPNTEDPFIEGDAITILFRYGTTAG